MYRGLLKDTIKRILELGSKEIEEERIDKLIDELLQLSNKEIIDSLAIRVLSLYENDNSKLLESLMLIRTSRLSLGL